jgi:hypothetical protein
MLRDEADTPDREKEMGKSVNIPIVWIEYSLCWLQRQTMLDVGVTKFGGGVN